MSGYPRVSKFVQFLKRPGLQVPTITDLFVDVLFYDF